MCVCYQKSGFLLGCQYSYRQIVCTAEALRFGPASQQHNRHLMIDVNISLY